ncbi:aldehyde dehydrogenase-like protein [Xylariaceae sp. FL0804]|nr:aldehyde dehydrogenase-like protein [Xylariaceae sp. FL0804]
MYRDFEVYAPFPDHLTNCYPNPDPTYLPSNMATTAESPIIQLDFGTFCNVIDGQCIKAAPESSRSTVNPATLGRNPDVPVATNEEVDRAVAAAQKAAKTWATLPWKDRQSALVRFTEGMEANAKGFAEMLVKEQGKTLNEAQGEMYLSAQFLRGTSLLELPEEEMERSDKREVVKRYTPLGVAVGIVPWNYPVFLACQRIGQALLTGNTFILKPSPLAPYCNLKLAELGTHFFPPGVLQALSGEADLGPALTAHAGVDVVTFAGSVATGRKVMEACSKTLKRVVLELGGNDPAVVCADVDVAAVAPAVAYLSFANSGQICTLPKRVYVHESIYDDFVAAMAAYARNLKLDTSEVVAIGPVSNEPQFESVKSLLADTEANNFALAAGSTQPLDDRPGFFLLPTIVDNPPDTARVVLEEPFGPIVPVLKWADEAEVVARANRTEYGLGASVWSRDTAQAGRIARQLNAGSVWINTHAEVDAKFPFGGHKSSGIGAEGGADGLKGYCNVQTIWSRLG